MKYNVSTDGSCIEFPNTGKVGGWGYVISTSNKVIEEQYGKLREGEQNPFRAELEAFCQALKECKNLLTDVSRFHFQTDSMMLYKAVSGLASRKGNRDIWSEIEELAPLFIGKVTIEKIKAHSNNPMNEKADELAKVGAQALFLAPVSGL